MSYAELVARENHRLDQIRQCFLNLKKGHEWARKHENDSEYANLYQKLLERVEQIYNDLEVLGVSKTFSSAVFIFGPELTQGLVAQFRKNSEKD